MSGAVVVGQRPAKCIISHGLVGVASVEHAPGQVSPAPVPVRPHAFPTIGRGGELATVGALRGVRRPLLCQSTGIFASSAVGVWVKRSTLSTDRSLCGCQRHSWAQ